MKIAYLCLLALVVTANVAARDRLDEFKPENARQEFEYDDSNDVPWEEQASKVPPVSLDALKPMNIDHGPQGVRFFLDRNSITINEKDRITRFWLAAKNGNKIVSLNFEAIRCSTRQYKQIAYASPRQPGKIRMLGAPKWRQIRSSELRDHHAEIADGYICAGSTPKTRKGVFSSLDGSYNAHNPYAEHTDL